MHCSRWRRSSTLGWYSQVMEVRTKGLIHGLVKHTHFWVSFTVPWWRNGSFQRPQSSQFSNRSMFRSSPLVMSLKWLKGYCQNNKRQRSDICKEFSVWHFVTKSTGVKSVWPGTSSHFFESRDPSYVSSAMYPECVRKEWRTKSFGIQSNVHWRLVYLVCDGFLYCFFCLSAKSYETINHYQSTPTAEWPRVRLRTRWSDYISDLAWSRLGMERAERSEIAVGREVFRVLLGLLSSRLSPKEKREREWVDEWACRPTLNLSIYEIVFSLFAKSEWRIQIIKHIWTETFVFMKIS